MKRSEYKKIIDISVLPKIQSKKNFGKIDWNKTIGLELQFECCDTNGKIIFMNQNKRKVLIKRIIEGSKNIKEVWVTKYAILNENLSHSVFNEIAFTCPDLLKYFVNKEDAYSLTKTSLKTAMCKCPVCGYIKPYAMAHLNSYGFICNKCSDKSFRYPNKFMMNFLDQTKCTYFSEASKSIDGLEWLDGYRYDFLVFTQCGKYFIEMDGHFHKNDNLMNGTTAEEQQKIDTYKDSLANKNGYKVIRIDCCYKSHQDKFTFIKNNIINSNIMSIFHISEQDINWNECNEYALSNVFYAICDCWNSGIRNTKDIARKLELSWSCVHENLLKGSELNLCDYNPKASRIDARNKQKEKYGMPCIVSKNDIIVGIFASGQELSKQSLERFGHFFNPGHISCVCTGKANTCFGYNIKRITRKEYEDMLLTIQN